MCGIFGVILRPQATLPYERVVYLLSRLYRLSESRGKESSGLHAYFPSRGEAWTLKEALPATQLLRSRDFQQLISGPLREAFDFRRNVATVPMAIMAHSRLVTNGAAERRQNNQPVSFADVTMIHNGIVVNVDELWKANPGLERHAEVDTEVMCALAADSLAAGAGPIGATSRIFQEIRGAASIAWVDRRADWLVLATNTGDLYYSVDTQSGHLLFASERFILEQTLRGLNGAHRADGGEAQWLAPGNGVVVDMSSFALHEFRTNGTPPPADPPIAPNGCPTTHHEIARERPDAPLVVAGRPNERLLRYNESAVRGLRRCSRCILPQTFPFIDFDEKGICNYCRSYRPRYKGLDARAEKQRFIASLQRYRSKDGSPDVLMAFSGGRDSSYGLHLVKKEFGLTPITFTYDWGMVTDLARRNIARLCGTLGIQNILVSADIKGKRENIRKNVVAWLRQPDLGMVPLFMAGDKHFFSVVNRLKRQTGIALDLWSANPLENTDFKSGFCGVPPDFAKERVDYLSFSRKLKLASYYAGRFLRNPSYLNASLFDTAGAFFAYYIEPRRNFFFLFHHLVWDETEVNRVLLDTYDWEVAPDTRSTWRIGDGTAPFYNYIYVTARGFSEFDTFRSNQIREGMISRESALAEVVVENRPRPEALRWYLDTIGLDFDATIRRINELDRMSLHAS